MGKLLLLIVGAAFAYSQTFEAVSIKPNPNPGGEASLQVVPGRLRIQNIPVRDLIQAAYGVEALQVTGGPKWLALDRFDIEAKAEGDPSTQQMQGPMLRALLEDRFKLIVHPDTIEGAVSSSESRKEAESFSLLAQGIAFPIVRMQRSRP